MSKAQFLFGDIVVVDKDQIGVIVKTYAPAFHQEPHQYVYEVYVRNDNDISEYYENQIERYQVRHKCLDDEELEHQNHED